VSTTPDDALQDYAVTEADDGVLDEAEEGEPDEQVPVRYDITSFGADFIVDGLVKRLRESDVYIPPFQRNFVWSTRDASRFIESLLLGLPVPGIFLSKDENSRLLVVDGQQRLKSLLSYYNDDLRDKHFKLQDVDLAFNGKRYSELDAADRRNLDNSVIHATIVQQNEPTDDDSGIYSIFERLNNGGRRLYPQEIRASIFTGAFSKLLSELNENEKWRAIYGEKESARLKDVEMILRFFALRYKNDSYEKPMKSFLNRFMKANRDLSEERRNNFRREFEATISTIESALGTRAFRPAKAFNAAVFDSVMVGVAIRLQQRDELSDGSLKLAYEALVKDAAFVAAYQRATSDPESVKERIRLATNAFAAA